MEYPTLAQLATETARFHESKPNINEGINQEFIERLVIVLVKLPKYLQWSLKDPEIIATFKFRTCQGMNSRINSSRNKVIYTCSSV